MKMYIHINNEDAFVSLSADVDDTGLSLSHVRVYEYGGGGCEELIGCAE